LQQSKLAKKWIKFWFGCICKSIFVLFHIIIVITIWWFPLLFWKYKELLFLFCKSYKMRRVRESCYLSS
jgi:hypothetical protein